MNQIAELSDRQIKILKAIVDEYIDSGDPVGSELLEKKFKVGYSPATIRNEMVVLGKYGYIQKSHFSSGRVPTPKAFRFYINTLLPKKPLSTAEEVSIKNEVWDYQGDEVRFLEEMASVLAEKSGLLAMVFLGSGFRYYVGMGNLLSLKEFLNYDFARVVFGQLVYVDYWIGILEDLMSNQKELEILLGEDYHMKQLMNLGSVFSGFSLRDQHGAIGLIGPCRLQYSAAVPLVNYTAQVIGQVYQK